MAPSAIDDTRASLFQQYQALEERDTVSDLTNFQTAERKREIPSASLLPQQRTDSGSQKVDIDWVPSFAIYRERVARRLKEGIPDVSVPPGFPRSVQYDACWAGDEMNEVHYVTQFSDSELQEIEAAVRHFKDLKLPLDDISPGTFHLPSLSKKLRQVASDVHRGRGFGILRGLDPTKYNTLDNIILYAGISSYIGERRGVQDNDGNILVHIKDVGAKVAPDHLRQSPYANNAQPYHNDLGDIIAMYVMERAENGGRSNIASTAAVYNDIAAKRPDLLHVLSKNNWAFDKHTDDESYYERPILFHDEQSGKVFFCFSRRQLTGSAVAPRPPSLPALTEAQAEALDAVHFSAASRSLSIQLERGDLQFINNLAVFHAREAFTDNEEGGRSRHIVRMWLRNEDLSLPTPQSLKEIWEEIYGPRTDRQWYMNPVHPRSHVINRQKSCHG